MFDKLIENKQKVNIYLGENWIYLPNVTITQYYEQFDLIQIDQQLFSAKSITKIEVLPAEQEMNASITKKKLIHPVDFDNSLYFQRQVIVLHHGTILEQGIIQSHDEHRVYINRREYAKGSFEFFCIQLKF